MAGYVWNGTETAETRGRKSKLNAGLCGTKDGYAQHKRRKEKQCDKCLAAHEKEAA